jgi:hypothetical protein
MSSPPYSPQTLAARWGCSSEKVRLMCKDRALASFSLGKLIRIPAAEVERFECQSLTLSPDTAENGQSCSPMAIDAFELRLVQQSEALPSLAPVRFGRSGTRPKANG